MSPREDVIAVLFGPPGSGKGTQAGWISRSFDLAHVSTGEMLRLEVEAGTELGREVEPIMTGGALVPDDLIVRVIEARLHQPDARHGVLLDGFPRTVPQAEALDAVLRRGGRDVDVVIALDVPVEELRDRILRRAAEEGRSDDTIEAIHIRMAEYEDKTAPVLAYYAENGGRVRRIEGVGSIDEVRTRIRAALSSIRGGSEAA